MLGTAVACLALLAVQAVGYVLNYGIIWHEVNSPEVKRTLINRLNSNLSRFSIVYSFLSMNLAVAVSLGVGMPPSVCYAVGILRHSLMWCYVLTLVASLVLRYLYVVVFKSVGMLNEDLIYTFLVSVTGYLGIYISMLVWFGDMRRPLQWHRCVSCPMLPEGRMHSTINSVIMRGLGLTVLSLHVLVSAKIWLHKRKAAPLNASESHLSGNAIDKESFVDLPTAVLSVALLVAGAMVALLLSRAWAGGVPFCFPRVNVVLVVLESVVAKAVYLLRNRDMRGKVFAMYAGRLGMSLSRWQ